MIIKHKVMVENNEEVLVVYLDNNLEEFANGLGDNSLEGEKNLLEQIKDYIKSKNINFTGNMVKVLAGGLLLATLSFAPGGGMEAKAAPMPTQSYVVEPGDNLWTIARNYDLTVDELKEINNLGTDIIQPGQTLQIRSSTQNRSVHIASTGDSLWGIARTYHLTVSELKSYNNMTSDTIHKGQALLLIPNAEIGRYRVQTGDSLWGIARKYQMSVDELKRLNDTTDVIQPGQMLKVVQARSPETYTVQPGDSLWSIANRNNVTVSQLQSMNQLDTTIIQPGQTIYVPYNTTPTVEAPVTDMTVTVQRTNGAVQSISLEDYVVGVVAAELGAGFNEASYKAQALAARTYAAKHVSEGKTITDTDSHQVYRDESQIRNAWGEHDYQTYYPMVRQAVYDTSGQVIQHDGEFIDALFFSTSNGRTEEPTFVWGGERPYLQSVDSHWDTRSPYYYRETIFTSSEFASRLGINASNIYIDVLSRTANGSVNTINISGRTFTGNYVKRRLGLRSTDFDIRLSGGRVNIAQRGWGHAVGLSQYGAYFMGEEGYTHEEIIHHYYQGVDIVNI